MYLSISVGLKIPIVATISSTATFIVSIFGTAFFYSYLHDKDTIFYFISLRSSLLFSILEPVVIFMTIKNKKPKKGKEKLQMQRLNFGNDDISVNDVEENSVSVQSYRETYSCTIREIKVDQTAKVTGDTIGKNDSDIESDYDKEILKSKKIIFVKPVD